MEKKISQDFYPPPTSYILKIALTMQAKYVTLTCFIDGMALCVYTRIEKVISISDDQTLVNII